MQDLTRHAGCMTRCIQWLLNIKSAFGGSNWRQCWGHRWLHIGSLGPVRLMKRSYSFQRSELWCRLGRRSIIDVRRWWIEYTGPCLASRRSLRVSRLRTVRFPPRSARLRLNDRWLRTAHLKRSRNAKPRVGRHPSHARRRWR